ncbi:hypothetical protein SAMN05421505_12019 [Sinosporangium album]|uniref:Uncharacterized protein n=1 Tax=Sinosporangium album TaxID=504805 RepID=A0A1G8EB06_9ACTN|nr:hypothetical protein [Sinosporangium album]SDH67073.1 hypothetical protein SAMN05421505_12019 [Sinosporangium album]
MAAQDKALAAWQALNERQQTYMRIIYRADQEAERWHKGAWSRGERAVSAAEWRWIEYGPVGTFKGASLGELQQALADAGVRSQGTGSTLKVLQTTTSSSCARGRRSSRSTTWT